MLKLMFITNDSALASHAFSCGVARIFVDLEVNGKLERQGHLDTVISDHCEKDIYRIKDSVPNAELLVRVNPFFEGSTSEINDVIKAGADLVMLPMFSTLAEVEEVSRIIDGRAKLIPLVETVDAVEILEDVVNVPGVSEIYIGLNDLHRELGLKFMFELLASGLVEEMTSIIKKAGLPFGFGGIARVGEGLLPAELILAEHVRLGSTRVILSRTFHYRSETLLQFNSYMDLEQEVAKIFAKMSELKLRNVDKVNADKAELIRIVSAIVEGRMNEENI